VLLTNQGSTAVAEPAAPVRFAVGPNRPNPFSRQTTILCALPEPGDLRATIYDVAGRAVRTFFRGQAPAGENAITWNGLDDGGRPLPSGIYYYRIEAGGQSATRKLVLAR
jgi:flagellar hook assembly protein FlgD